MDEEYGAVDADLEQKADYTLYNIYPTRLILFSFAENHTPFKVFLRILT